MVSNDEQSSRGKCSLVLLGNLRKHYWLNLHPYCTKQLFYYINELDYIQETRKTQNILQFSDMAGLEGYEAITKYI